MNGPVISTAEIETMLMNLPQQLLESDLYIGSKRRELNELNEQVTFAETNAMLGAPADGKDAATRDLQRKQFVLRDADVMQAKNAARNASAAMENEEANNQQLRRQFAAACHLAEMRAAQMRLTATGVSK